jgi:hypothetical protein
MFGYTVLFCFVSFSFSYVYSVFFMLFHVPMSLFIRACCAHSGKDVLLPTSRSLSTLLFYRLLDLFMGFPFDLYRFCCSLCDCGLGDPGCCVYGFLALYKTLPRAFTAECALISCHISFSVL